MRLAFGGEESEVVRRVLARRGVIDIPNRRAVNDEAKQN